MFFLELSCFFDDPADVGNLISGSSAFSKTSLNIWKFTVHILLRPGLENFEHYYTNMWDECNCAVVWAFFGIAFLWDWNENWRFPVLWPLLSFPNSKWIPWPNDCPSVLVTHSNEPSLSWPRMNPVLKSKTGLLLYRCILLSCLLFHCTILAFSFSKLASSKRAHCHRHYFLHPSKDNNKFFERENTTTLMFGEF